jgi:hypothetical protein
MSKRDPMPQNVEASRFRRGQYVGYSNGVWLITRSNTYYGERLPAKWSAVHRDDPNMPRVYGRTLAEIGRKISAAGKAEKLDRNPKRRKRHVVRKRVTRRGARVALRFTRKANTAKKQREWKHVYRSARCRGYSKGRAIAQASGVVRKETLRRNPSKRYIIEALTLSGYTPRYFYWNDAAQKFTTKREHASPYSSEKAARIEAKKMVLRLPRAIRSLRVVPV